MPASGRPSRASWTAVVIGLVAVALSQPSFLLLMWHFNIAPAIFTGANDLAAIMGAIFTSGGLVIALISIYTMANVEAVSQRAVEPLFAQIPQEVDARIRRFLEAYGHFTQAKSAEGTGFGYSMSVLDAVDSLIGKALALESTISGIYFWTGQFYFKAAALSFISTTVPDKFGSGSTPVPSRAEFPAVASRAVHWLNEARLRGDGDISEIDAELAELHGMMHASVSKLVHLIGKANHNATMLPSRPVGLAFLFAPCKSESDVKKIAGALHVEAPMSISDIKELVIKKRDLPWQESALLLLAIPKSLEWSPSADLNSPMCVRILHQNQATEGTASWVPRVQPGVVMQRDGIPPFAFDANGNQISPAVAPIDEVLEKLVDRFYIIAEIDYSRFPERS